ncbi:hypothetical protein AMS62_14835 [Bacillus sp. FJAT-18019]|uniref:Uncharacterized protein n=1 Tax=Paenibacillus solani TaxID=1705565 RepID=A0A0M1NJB1_9BACL|nr:hypothetical protein [Paenibacillus solani]KOP66362.1 hypothetical protein AMS62_14835 [Bacillus sp. FJAT-18019]KOR81954.1 hypothetical protein AM231_20510 [Paenibacillus solani]
MNDFLKNYLRTLLMLIVFIVGVGLVIVGQKDIGAPGLGLMLLGLAMLITLLWLYNRKYK